MNSNRRLLFFSRISSDIILIISCFYTTSSLTGIAPPFHLKESYYLFLFVLILVWFFSSRASGLYDDFRSSRFSSEIIVLIKNVFIQSIALILLLFVSSNFFYSRSFVLFYSFFLFLLLGSEKYIVRKILVYFRKKGRNLRNVLIIGAGEIGMNIYEAIKGNAQYGYRLAGFLDDEVKPYLNGEYLGKIQNLSLVLRNKQIDNIIIALPESAEKKIENVVKISEIYDKRVKIIPDYFRYVSKKNNLAMIERFPSISIRGESLNELHWKFIKRTLDIFLSSMFFILAGWWLCPIISLAIKLTSKGPIFYKQERWGRDNKKFITYKFRTMTFPFEETDIEGNFLQTKKNDPRVTKFGRILRKNSLDELPQFWNVLKGDMTIVGPRPHPTPINVESGNKIELYMLRHLVKPGITGWAQVNGYRGGINIKNSGHMRERINHDLWYIENWSLWLDIEIIFLTIWGMIKGDPNAF